MCNIVRCWTVHIMRCTQSQVLLWLDQIRSKWEWWFVHQRMDLITGAFSSNSLILIQPSTSFLTYAQILKVAKLMCYTCICTYYMISLFVQVLFPLSFNCVRLHLIDKCGYLSLDKLNNKSSIWILWGEYKA